jgi:replicative DNA helicase
LTSALDRVPPHNIEAEMALLGSVLIDRTIVPIVAQHLDGPVFYAHIHETLWQTILRLYDADQPIDKISVAEELRRRDALERIGGLPYLNLLMDSVQTAASAEYYAKIVREKAILRELIAAGRKIIELAYDGEEDVVAAVDAAEQLVRDAGGGVAAADVGITASEAAFRIWKEFDAAAAGPKTSGMRTPWKAINAITGGFFPGEMCIWPAAAKMGKSSALNTLAHYTAEEEGLVLYFALEMGWRNTIRRLIATVGNIEARLIRKGELNRFETDRFGEGMEAIASLRLRCFNRRKSVADIRRIARRLHHDEPVKAIIVDHVGFLSDVTRRPRGVSMNEALNLAYIELLELAEELGCVVHAVAHINREGMKRGEPRLEDIRDGGNPEGHAHVIIAPYRPDPINDPTSGKFIILANREGGTGAIDMSFEGKRNLWREIRTDENGQRVRPLWFEETAA